MLLLILPLLVGSLSGYLTRNKISGSYKNLKKPSFNPPNYIFGPVWTILYILMGISLQIISNKPNNEKTLIIFYVQLFLNFMWSIVFFNLNRLDFSIIIILGMLTSIIFMIIYMRKINPLSGNLQIPYLLWVIFATILNISIWWLNNPYKK